MPQPSSPAYSTSYGKLPLPVRPLARFKDALMDDWSGGPRLAKLNWVINATKVGTLAFCLANAHYRGILRTSPTMALYSGLHGGYGLAWCLKELTFPDPNWQRWCTAGTIAAAVGGILGPYWLAPFLLAKDIAAKGREAEASPVKMLGCTLAFVTGLVLMVGADAQKFFILREKTRVAAAETAEKDAEGANVDREASTLPTSASADAQARDASAETHTTGGDTFAFQTRSTAPMSNKASKRLISDGFFARIRHPNYLGEMMIYGSFAALSGRLEPWAVLAFVWGAVFLPNIYQKEVSMSRYAEWPAYVARTGLLFPKVF